MTKSTQYHRRFGFALALCIAFACIWIFLGTEPDVGWSLESNTQGRSEAHFSERAQLLIDPESAMDSTMKKQEESRNVDRPKTRQQPLVLSPHEQSPANGLDTNEIEEIPSETQHLGKYIDPDADPWTYMDEKNPPENQHLGEYINPDDDPWTLSGEENPTEIQHLGEYIDPDEDPWTSTIMEKNPGQ